MALIKPKPSLGISEYEYSSSPDSMITHPNYNSTSQDMLKGTSTNLIHPSMFNSSIKKIIRVQPNVNHRYFDDTRNISMIDNSISVNDSLVDDTTFIP